MENISEYIKKDRNFRYRLPMSFWENIWFELMVVLLNKVTFRKRIFVSSEHGFNIYYEYIINYIKKIFKVDFFFKSAYINNHFIGYKSHVYLDKLYGFGFSYESKEEALSKAIGEFLERYYSRGLDVAKIEFIKVKKQNMKREYSTSSYHNFSDKQKEIFGELKVDDNSYLRCVKLTDLTDGAIINYPLQQVYWGSSVLKREEGVLSDTTTSGCAGGFTKEEAILAAIYENIERDSFFCHWLTKSSPTKLEVETGIIKDFDTIRNKFNDYGYILELYDITSDLHIPTCLCLIRSKEGGRIAISAGANITMLKAIEGAISEVNGCIYLLETRNSYTLPKDYKPFFDISIERNERLMYWSKQKDNNKIDFILKSKVKKIKKEYFEIEKKFKNKNDELNFLLNIFKNKGNDYNKILLYEFKSDVLDKLCYNVVRIIIPKLYPLYLREYLCLTDSIRLKEFNLWKNGTVDFKINEDIHPFP